MDQKHVYPLPSISLNNCNIFNLLNGSLPGRQNHLTYKQNPKHMRNFRHTPLLEAPRQETFKAYIVIDS